VTQNYGQEQAILILSIKSVK